MRVQRILKQPQKKSRLGERLIATLFILATFSLFAFQQKEAPSTDVMESLNAVKALDLEKVISQLETKKPVSPTTNKIEIIKEQKQSLNTKMIVLNQDTIPVGDNRSVRIKTNENGKKMMIETKDGEIENLMINNNVINPKDYGKYEKEIAQLLESTVNIPTPPSLESIPPPPPPAPTNDLDKIPPPPAPSSDLREIKITDENGTTLLREESRKEMKKRMEEERKRRTATSEKDVAEYKKEKIKEREELRKNADKRRREIDRERTKARALSSTSEEWRAEQEERIEKMKEDALLQREDLEALAEHRKAIIEQRKAALLQAAESQRQVIHAEKANEQTTRIEEELKKDGLYNNGIYRFKLSNKELKINGKKQSTAMYKKYKKICEKDYEGVGVDYSFEIRRTKNGSKRSISIGEFKEQ